MADPDGDQLDVKWFVNGSLERQTLTAAASDSFTHTFELGVNSVMITVDDGEKIAADVKDAVAQIESKTVAGVIQGMKDFGDVFETMASGVQTCSQPKDLEELLKLKKMMALLLC